MRAPGNCESGACCPKHWLKKLQPAKSRLKKDEKQRILEPGTMVPETRLPVVAAQELDGARGLWKDGEKI